MTHRKNTKKQIDNPEFFKGFMQKYLQEYLERFNQEIKRRTNVIRIFPNRDSAVRLIGALCMEQSEEWITGRQYLDMSLVDEEEQRLKTNKPKQSKTVAA